MKKIQKKLSVVLAVMMVLCMFTALPFSASAAETSEETSAGNKINVTSNVTDPVSYDYNAQTEQVVVTYLLKADHMIVDTQAVRRSVWTCDKRTTSFGAYLTSPLLVESLMIKQHSMQVNRWLYLRRVWCAAFSARRMPWGASFFSIMRLTALPVS